MRVFLFFLVGLLLPGFAGCSSAFFFPSRALFSTPDKFGLLYEEVQFRSEDGTKLNGWWLPATGEEKGTILFLHGNAENISTNYHIVSWLPREGYSVFLFDYRGYGASEGDAEVQGAVADIRSSFDFLRGPGKKRFHVYAQSLGGSLLIMALAQKKVPEEILSLTFEGSFSSFRGIARDKFRAFWLTWPFQFLPYLLLPGTDMTELLPPSPHVPLLFIHGSGDLVVPYYHSEKMFKAATPPKDFWLIPEGQHGDTFSRLEQRFRYLDFLEGALRTREDPSESELSVYPKGR